MSSVFSPVWLVLVSSDSATPAFDSDFEKIVEEQHSLLKPIRDSWQPTDVLPDLNREDWRDQVSELRSAAAKLPPELLVALVGNTITEEALPTYQTWLNRYSAMGDPTGVADNPWAVWTRGWTAEENRHGDILNRYLYLSGRIDMRCFEVTVQHLISRGFDPKTGDNPYMGLAYVAFQERATRIAHLNVAELASRYGDPILAKICRLISGDEARHEEAYKKIFGKLIQIHPEESVKAFYLMMKQGVSMPASLMSDGTPTDLYGKYMLTAQQIGVYTAHDYSDVIEHLVDFWKVAGMRNLSGDAAMAQDYLCGLSVRHSKRANAIKRAADRAPQQTFEWIS